MEIWSDVVCPWCALGRRRFAAALARFPHADEVEVRYRSYELDPGAPRRHEGDREERLAAKFGSDRAQVRAMHDRMTAMGAAEGVEFRFDDAQDGSTVDAHRLLHLAWDAGGAALQETLKERLQRGYFTEGEPIGEPEALRRLAVDAGLPTAAVDRVLGSDEYLDAVRSDEDQARRYGITGVPFFAVDATYGASGAQPADTLLQLLEKAWEEGRARSA
ncbi:DsbA family oxidoreductase [Pseudonocardia sp. RS11V-5]|uniref:DsbA family oxidoreductase n=1 Tax=Pseudonocardia terrae TaxID=2905831 RepID=UPI001E454D20|nr:DsbA family oxidoreductase [Pseudonocardia terrae]MCE3553904.1 DsbA family oxidoreductase [Pseudonocardia terrae]